MASLTAIILIIFLVIRNIVSVPIRIRGNELEMSIQVDEIYSSNLYAKTKFILNTHEYHLIELADLWPMFGNIFPQMNDSDYFTVLGIHSFNKNVTLCRAPSSLSFSSSSIFSNSSSESYSDSLSSNYSLSTTTTTTTTPKSSSSNSSQNSKTFENFHHIRNGTNLGIVLKHSHSANISQNSDNNRLCLYNPNRENITVMLLINLYDQFQPIPGGCNIEFELENSPFILARRFERFTTFDDYSLDFQPGSPSPRAKFDYKSFKCNLHTTGQRLRYRLYVAYHDHYEDDNPEASEDNYFKHIISMSHIDWIKNNAKLIAELKHESSIGRLYILTANTETSRRLYFNVLLSDQMVERSEVYEDDFYYSSLYVPVSVTGNENTNPSLIHVHSFQHSFNLCFLLASLSLFSMIVSLFGYRFFILEVFYFSFLQIFGASLCCLTSLKLTPNTSSSRLVNIIDSMNLLPSVTTWNILISTIIALILSSVWTEACRRSRNIKLALSGHCMILTSIVIAITFDAVLVFGNANITLWLSEPVHYLLIITILMFMIVILYSLLLFYLDLFWLSALSTAITAVYLILLPLDIFVFGGGILFRVLYNIWLLSFTTFSTSSGDLIVSFITLNIRDIITILIYFLLASASIYWQTLTKLGNLRTYGFGCIRPQVKAQSTVSNGGDSPSSTPSTVITALSIINRARIKRTNLNIKVLQSTVDDCEKAMVVESDLSRDMFAQERINKQQQQQQQQQQHDLEDGRQEENGRLRRIRNNSYRRSSQFIRSWRKKVRAVTGTATAAAATTTTTTTITNSEKDRKKRRKSVGKRVKQRKSFRNRAGSYRHRSVSASRSIMKMYRCKYCNKLSTNRHCTKQTRNCPSSATITTISSSLRRQNSLLRSRKRNSFRTLRRVDTERTRLRLAQLESLNAVQAELQNHSVLQQHQNSTLHHLSPVQQTEFSLLEEQQQQLHQELLLESRHGSTQQQQQQQQQQQRRQQQQQQQSILEEQQQLSCFESIEILQTQISTLNSNIAEGDIGLDDSGSVYEMDSLII